MGDLVYACADCGATRTSGELSPDNVCLGGCCQPLSSEEAMTRCEVIVGDCRDVLGALGAGSVQTCVTSPPYFGLRDYGHDGQIGLEPTPDEFVAALVGVFREVRRVLRDDGTLWLNLGDSYAGGGRGGHECGNIVGTVPQGVGNGVPRSFRGMKAKDLLGVPWMVAFALRADGWYLRSDIIWAKPNPMPESVTDRPTKAHEYLFLLAKSQRYYYDADAIRENWADERNGASGTKSLAYSELSGRNGDSGLGSEPPYIGRNKRSVWPVATQPYEGAHFATFPPKLVEPCILAGSREGDLVLDPFNGAGTTGLVAQRNGRSYIGIELNPAYAQMARERLTAVDTPLPGLAA